MTKLPLPSNRGPIIASGLVVALTFGVFGYWGATQKLSAAAVAPATVMVEYQRAKVQHFEGGIIAELAVRDGDYVTKGETLLVLSNTEEAARFERLTARQVALDAEAARLRSELEDRETIDEAEFAAAWADAPDAATAMQFQRELFEVRRAQLGQALAIARDDLLRAEEKVVGIDAQIRAVSTQLEITRARLKDVTTMREKGLTTQLAVNGVRAETSGLEADFAQLESARRSSLTEIKQKTDEIKRIQSNYAVRAGDRLNAIELELAELEEERSAAAEVISRTQIVAPSEGRVVGMAVNTIGAVVASGDVLMEIVPTKDRLVVSADIRPEDIDVIHTGLDVDVRFPALSFRNTLPVSGTLEKISADRIVDGRTGAAVYKGVVTLDIEDNMITADAELVAGMSAEVVIKTGERTLLEYLLDPISKSVSRALRES